MRSEIKFRRFNKSLDIKVNGHQVYVRVAVLFITTPEKKFGFLLIAVFKKLFNPQNDGHQG